MDRDLVKELEEGEIALIKNKSKEEQVENEEFIFRLTFSSSDLRWKVSAQSKGKYGIIRACSFEDYEEARKYLYELKDKYF